MAGQLVTLDQSSQGNSNVALSSAGIYETIAAGQTDQVLGTNGKKGDVLSGLLIVPATTSPGAVSVKDGSGGSITLFTGGATSVADLKPFWLPLSMISVSGPWKLTTGTNVSVVAVGRFS